MWISALLKPCQSIIGTVTRRSQDSYRTKRWDLFRLSGKPDAELTCNDGFKQRSSNCLSIRCYPHLWEVTAKTFVRKPAWIYKMSPSLFDCKIFFICVNFFWDCLATCTRALCPFFFRICSLLTPILNNIFWRCHKMNMPRKIWVRLPHKTKLANHFIDFPHLYYETVPCGALWYKRSVTNW